MIEAFIRKWLPVDEQAARDIAENLACSVQPKDPELPLSELVARIKDSITQMGLLGLTPDEQAMLSPQRTGVFTLTWHDENLVNTGATIDIDPASVQCPYGNGPLEIHSM